MKIQDNYSFCPVETLPKNNISANKGQTSTNVQTGLQDTILSLSKEGMSMSKVPTSLEDGAITSANVRKAQITVNGGTMEGEEGAVYTSSFRVNYTFVQNKNFTMEKIHIKKPKGDFSGEDLNELAQKAIEMFKEQDPVKGAVKIDLSVDELKPPPVEEENPIEPLLVEEGLDDFGYLEGMVEELEQLPEDYVQLPETQESLVDEEFINDMLE